MSTDCKCPICLDTPNDSRQLTCGHSLCLSCCRVVNQKVVCSLCRKATCVNSAEELPPTTTTSSDKQCSECDKKATVYCAECSSEGVFLCETHDTFMHLMRSRKHHHVEIIGSETKKDVKKVKKCTQHEQACELWCSDCKKPVCSQCLVSTVHKNHSFTVLNDQHDITPEARILAKKQENLDRQMEMQKAIEARFRHIADLQLQLAKKETELAANKAITDKVKVDMDNAYASFKKDPNNKVANRTSADVRMLQEQQRKSVRRQMIKSTEVNEEFRQALQTQHEAEELKKKIHLLKREVAKIQHEASLEESATVRLKAAKRVQEIKLKQRPAKVTNSPFVRFNAMIYKTITGIKSPKATPTKKEQRILSFSLELEKPSSPMAVEKPQLKPQHFSVYQPMVEKYKYEFFAIKSLFDQLLEFNKRAPLAPPKPSFSIFHPLVEKYRFLQIKCLFEQLLKANDQIIPATPAPTAPLSKEEQENARWVAEAKKVGPSPPPKAVYIPGSSKIEYKRYMICRYEYEQWENQILLLSRKLKQAQVYACKSN